MLDITMDHVYTPHTHDLRVRGAKFRAINSVVECFLHTEEVACSSHASPTKKRPVPDNGAGFFAFQI